MGTPDQLRDQSDSDGDPDEENMRAEKMQDEAKEYCSLEEGQAEDGHRELLLKGIGAWRSLGTDRARQKAWSDEPHCNAYERHDGDRPFHRMSWRSLCLRWKPEHYIDEENPRDEECDPHGPNQISHFRGLILHAQSSCEKPLCPGAQVLAPE